MCDETGAPCSEVARLRAEVAALRETLNLALSRLAPQAWLPNAAAPCTCGTTGGCLAHPPMNQPNIWVSSQNIGGAAGYSPAITWMPGDAPLNIQNQTQGAAGCPSTLIYTVSAP